MALNSGGPRPTKGRVNLLAICEVCTILVGNVPSMICGIVVLTQLKDYRE